MRSPFSEALVREMCDNVELFTANIQNFDDFKRALDSCSKAERSNREVSVARLLIECVFNEPDRFRCFIKNSQEFCRIINLTGIYIDSNDFDRLFTMLLSEPNIPFLKSNLLRDLNDLRTISKAFPRYIERIEIFISEHISNFKGTSLLHAKDLFEYEQGRLFRRYYDYVLKHPEQADSLVLNLSQLNTIKTHAPECANTLMGFITNEPHSILNHPEAFGKVFQSVTGAISTNHPSDLGLVIAAFPQYEGAILRSILNNEKIFNRLFGTRREYKLPQDKALFLFRHYADILLSVDKDSFASREVLQTAIQNHTELDNTLFYSTYFTEQMIGCVLLYPTDISLLVRNTEDLLLLIKTPAFLNSNPNLQKRLITYIATIPALFHKIFSHQQNTPDSFVRVLLALAQYAQELFYLFLNDKVVFANIIDRLSSADIEALRAGGLTKEAEILDHAQAIDSTPEEKRVHALETTHFSFYNDIMNIQENSTTPFADQVTPGMIVCVLQNPGNIVDLIKNVSQLAEIRKKFPNYSFELMEKILDDAEIFEAIFQWATWSDILAITQHTETEQNEKLLFAILKTLTVFKSVMKDKALKTLKEEFPLSQSSFLDKKLANCLAEPTVLGNLIKQKSLMEIIELLPVFPHISTVLHVAFTTPNVLRNAMKGSEIGEFIGVLEQAIQFLADKNPTLRGLLLELCLRPWILDILNTPPIYEMFAPMQNPTPQNNQPQRDLTFLTRLAPAHLRHVFNLPEITGALDDEARRKALHHYIAHPRDVGYGKKTVTQTNISSSTDTEFQPAAHQPTPSPSPAIEDQVSLFFSPSPSSVAENQASLFFNPSPSSVTENQAFLFLSPSPSSVTENQISSLLSPATNSAAENQDGSLHERRSIPLFRIDSVTSSEEEDDESLGDDENLSEVTHKPGVQ